MFGSSFYHQTIKKYVIAFGSLFNDITIKKFGANNVAVDLYKVPINYGPKQKFLQRITEDPNLDRNAAIVLPRISFEMNNITYDNIRKTNSLNKCYANIDGDIKVMLNPVPYNFTFDLAIMTKNAEDGTQILEQILPYFKPDFNVTVKTLPDLSISVDTPIILNSVTYNDQYEGNFLTRRAIIWDLNFLLKGYIYNEIKGGGKLITSSEVSVALTDTPTTNTTITVTPDPADANVDDDYGFSETKVVNI